jgi:hypothetical protein
MGSPQRIRVDNGTPWATQSSLPSALALWLVGLDIVPIYGRPARSTDNAVVERSHGLLAQWVEPVTCANATVCAERLAWAVYTQRNRYRDPPTLTRCQAFPTLLTNSRRYDPLYDSAACSLQRVVTYLSHFRFQRKVEKFGQITLFANTYSIRRAFSRQAVEIVLDVLTLNWIICDEYAHEIIRHPNKEFAYHLISQLLLAKRRKFNTT